MYIVSSNTSGLGITVELYCLFLLLVMRDLNCSVPLMLYMEDWVLFGLRCRTGFFPVIRSLFATGIREAVEVNLRESRIYFVA